MLSLFTVLLLALSLGRFTQSLSTKTSKEKYFSEKNFPTQLASIIRVPKYTRATGLAGNLYGNLGLDAG